jgi:hypothetical protein
VCSCYCARLRRGHGGNKTGVGSGRQIMYWVTDSMYDELRFFSRAALGMMRGASRLYLVVHVRTDC